MVIRLGTWRNRPLRSTLVFLAGTGLYLFFRFLLTCLSDTRAHWAGRNSAGKRILARRSTFVWLQPRHLVCAHLALAFKRPEYVDCTVLGRHGCIVCYWR